MNCFTVFLNSVVSNITNSNHTLGFLVEFSSRKDEKTHLQERTDDENDESRNDDTTLTEQQIFKLLTAVSESAFICNPTATPDGRNSWKRNSFLYNLSQSLSEDTRYYQVTYYVHVHNVTVTNICTYI